MFVAVASSAELHCEYSFKVSSNLYECIGTVTTSTGDFMIESVTGNHIPGHNNDELSRVVIRNVSMGAMPKHFGVFFKNFRELAIANVANFPNFKRSDFDDFVGLVGFGASNLPMVTQIPRDTFWDMTQLTHLYLDSMTNMGLFNADMLINARSLQVFSARGPNKIMQINPGFFRNQMQTLQSVDFRGTNLKRIGFSVFQGLFALNSGRFVNAGCLDSTYVGDNVAQLLTNDIRMRCQDVPRMENRIMKNSPLDSSSSSSSSDSSEA